MADITALPKGGRVGGTPAPTLATAGAAARSNSVSALTSPRRAKTPQELADAVLFNHGTVYVEKIRHLVDGNHSERLRGEPAWLRWLRNPPLEVRVRYDEFRQAHTDQFKKKFAHRLRNVLVATGAVEWTRGKGVTDVLLPRGVHFDWPAAITALRAAQAADAVSKASGPGDSTTTGGGGTSAGDDTPFTDAADAASTPSASDDGTGTPAAPPSASDVGSATPDVGSRFHMRAPPQTAAAAATPAVAASPAAVARVPAAAAASARPAATSSAATTGMDASGHTYAADARIASVFAEAAKEEEARGASSRADVHIVPTVAASGPFDSLNELVAALPHLQHVHVKPAEAVFTEPGVGSSGGGGATTHYRSASRKRSAAPSAAVAAAAARASDSPAASPDAAPAGSPPPPVAAGGALPLPASDRIYRRRSTSTFTLRREQRAEEKAQHIQAAVARASQPAGGAGDAGAAATAGGHHRAVSSSPSPRALAATTAAMVPGAGRRAVHWVDDDGDGDDDAIEEEDEEDALPTPLRGAATAGAAAAAAAASASEPSGFHAATAAGHPSYAAVAAASLPTPVPASPAAGHGTARRTAELEWDDSTEGEVYAYYDIENKTPPGVSIPAIIDTLQLTLQNAGIMGENDDLRVFAAASPYSHRVAEGEAAPEAPMSAPRLSTWFRQCKQARVNLVCAPPEADGADGVISDRVRADVRHLKRPQVAPLVKAFVVITDDHFIVDDLVIIAKAFGHPSVQYNSTGTVSSLATPVVAAAPAGVSPAAAGAADGAGASSGGGGAGAVPVPVPSVPYTGPRIIAFGVHPARMLAECDVIDTWFRATDLFRAAAVNERTQERRDMRAGIAIARPSPLRNVRNLPREWDGVDYMGGEAPDWAYRKPKLPPPPPTEEEDDGRAAAHARSVTPSAALARPRSSSRAGSAYAGGGSSSRSASQLRGGGRSGSVLRATSRHANVDPDDYIGGGKHARRASVSPSLRSGRRASFTMPGPAYVSDAETPTDSDVASSPAPRHRAALSPSADTDERRVGPGPAYVDYLAPSTHGGGEGRAVSATRIRRSSSPAPGDHAGRRSSPGPVYHAHRGDDTGSTPRDETATPTASAATGLTSP